MSQKPITSLDILYGTVTLDEFNKVLFQVYGEKCFYCDVEFSKEIPPTVDHYIPQVECKRRGWDAVQTHGITNCRPSCQRCNAKKADRIPNEDGTLPPKRPSRADRAIAKRNRPEVCETCMSGRILLLGEECPDCGSGPQPASAPSAYQKSPKDCSHGWDDPRDHCWMCYLGFIERRPAIETVLHTDKES